MLQPLKHFTYPAWRVSLQCIHTGAFLVIFIIVWIQPLFSSLPLLTVCPWTPNPSALMLIAPYLRTPPPTPFLLCLLGHPPCTSSLGEHPEWSSSSFLFASKPSLSPYCLLLPSAVMCWDCRSALSGRLQLQLLLFLSFLLFLLHRHYLM